MVLNFKLSPPASQPSNSHKLFGGQGTYDVLIFLCIVGDFRNRDVSANILPVLSLTCNQSQSLPLLPWSPTTNLDIPVAPLHQTVR